jgi:hypothetical protein
VKGPLRKLATKICDLPVLISGLLLSVYLSSQKVRTVVSINEVTVFPTVSFLVPFFLVLSFQGTSEFRKQKTAMLLSMNHHRDP